LFDDETETEIPDQYDDIIEQRYSPPDMRYYKMKLIKEVYSDLVACDVRINSFIDENSEFKPPRFNAPQRHFMSAPLSQAMTKVKNFERYI